MANKYWVAPYESTFDSTFWSAISGGAPGLTIAPGDFAHFTSGGLSNCHIDNTTSVKFLTSSPGYTGTITQKAPFSVGADASCMSGRFISFSQFTVGYNFVVGSDFTSSLSGISVGADSTISGTLVLNGDLICNGAVDVTPTGRIIPVPTQVSSLYSCPSRTDVFPNGRSAHVTSLNSNITIDGTVDGRGFGFSSNAGPGANSTLPDRLGDPVPFYGATHAGVGFVRGIPGNVTWRQYEHRITVAEADQAWLLLDSYPVTPSEVSVDVIGGIAQEYNLDYSIDGNRLQWLTAGLTPLIKGDGQIIVGTDQTNGPLSADSTGTIVKTNTLNAFNPAAAGDDLIAIPRTAPYPQIRKIVSKIDSTTLIIDTPFIPNLTLDPWSVKFQGDIFRISFIGDDSIVPPPPKPPYGSFRAPTSVGSGSGIAAGGSGVKLTAPLGTVTIRGSINMNGQDGTGPGSGGGAGGSVWVVATDISGSGSIQAKGGSSTYQYAGGGGGGYITLNYGKGNAFAGATSVVGQAGGTDGYFWTDQIRPILEDKFTGHILNTKWWDVRQPVVLNNAVWMYSPIGDPQNPEIASRFSVSGQNILTEVDFTPVGSEPSYHTSYFQLMADDENWVAVARKYDTMFGLYMINGSPYQTGMYYAYNPATFRINKQDSTFAFQFIDASTGLQTIFSESIPGLQNRKFQVKIGTDREVAGDSTRIVDIFTLDDIDIANKYVTLSTLPDKTSEVALNIVGSSAQNYGYDYFVQGQRLYWDASYLPAIPPVTFIITDYFTITQHDLDYGYVHLSRTPSIIYYHGSVQIGVDIVGGSSQIYGTDFTSSGDQVIWSGLGLQSQLIVGDEIRVEYLWAQHSEVFLQDILKVGDQLIAHYATDFIPNDLDIQWDNFKVWDGIIHDAYSKDPVIYVDSSNGSDSYEGCQLSPLQNLFVATAWAKHGGTVVLYDGTYNSTDICDKNLTIMGANGASPLVTCQNVLDSTGSNWENSAITFRNGQGIISNLHVMGVTNGIEAKNTKYLQVRGCDITGSQIGINVYGYSDQPNILQNTIHGVQQGIVFNRVSDGMVYSNVSYDMSNCVSAHYCRNLTVSSNTFDEVLIGVSVDSSSDATIVSNNLTYCALVSAQCSSDSSMRLYNNNFFATPIYYAGPILEQTGNIDQDPSYIDRTGRNYLLQAVSPDIGIGTGQFDRNFLDRRNAPRFDASYSIGAYEFLDATHSSGSTYVSTLGDDYYNSGSSINSPYRTIDKAMSVTDGTVILSGGGHLDSYNLGLRTQPVHLDGSRILRLDSHFSSINLGLAAFVSVNGSDESGTGSRAFPYRTVDRALQDNTARSVIVMSGEYAWMNGRDSRVMMDAADRTAVPDYLGRYYMESLFGTYPTAFPNHVYIEKDWDLSSTPNSDATIYDGYLSLSYDGTNSCRADSLFQIHSDFEVSAELRQAFDPFFFSATNSDNTVALRIENGDYTSSIYTGGQQYSCWGSIQEGYSTNFPFTDYVCVSGDDLARKFISLTYLVEDSTNVSVDIVGGNSQELGVDFYVEDGKIKWDGLTLESNLREGEVIRVIYKARGLSDPVRFTMGYRNGYITVNKKSQIGADAIMRRRVLYDSSGPWSISFYMDQTNATVNHSEVLGHGYASKFYAISSQFDGSNHAEPFANKTLRQPMLVYQTR